MQLIHLKQDGQKYKSSLELLSRHELHKTQCKGILANRVPSHGACRGYQTSRACRSHHHPAPAIPGATRSSAAHFAFHLQLPGKCSRVFAVQLRSEQGMPRGSSGIWAHLLICHSEHTSFRAPFKTKPASSSQHNTFSSALQKHFAWQRIQKQFVHLKGDIQVGFRRNDSEDDWKKSKESLKMPVWGSPLT